MMMPTGLISQNMDQRDREKELAARAAVGEVEDGMMVGVGTGSTVAFAIVALAERVRSGLRIRTVGTSLRTEALIRAAGMECDDFSPLDTVDLCIDGVDEIDGQFSAVKGGGGAMLREKIVASAATRMIAIADSSKAVDRLGRALLPVEVLPFATAFVAGRIRGLGGEPMVRRLADGRPFSTDQGNVVLDCRFGDFGELGRLAGDLSGTPGVLGHGLFIDQIDALYIARGDTVEIRERS